MEAAILRQVEYYFGDINLSKDEFLKTTLSENDGWLPFEILLKFKRLAQMTTDVEVIRKALSSSNLLEVSDRGVRRDPSNPPPETLEEAMNRNIDRALYVKGFPLELKLDEAISWLDTNVGETVDVFLKRGMNRKFKGSIYVTFKEKSAAEKFMTSPAFASYHDKPILRKWYKDYRADKKRIIEAKLLKRENKKNNILKRITVGALLELSGLPSINSEAEPKLEDQNRENVEDQSENNEPAKDAADLGVNSPVTKRTVTNLKNWISGNISSPANIAWVDILARENKAIVRFKEANVAAKVLNEIAERFENGKIIYENSILSGRCIEGDEEIEIWKHILERMDTKKRKASKSNGGKRNKRRRRN